MEVGIIHMDDVKISDDWINFLNKYKINAEIINYKEEKIIDRVRNSKIRCWILTGSNRMIGEKEYPCVDFELFLLDKNYLCICYSHQLFCAYMGFQLKYMKDYRRGIYRVNWKKKNYFCKTDKYYFYHKMYVENDRSNKKLKILSSNENKIYSTKWYNVLTIQFHPEKHESTHGLLYEWMKKNI
jgi:GMP synthase-like glutamine amidotransferase